MVQVFICFLQSKPWLQGQICSSKTLSKSSVYTIKIFDERVQKIGGNQIKVKMDDFEKYISLYVCILCTAISRYRLRMRRIRPKSMAPEKEKNKLCYMLGIRS